MKDKELIYKGSTKDIFRCADNYLFKFSDRYSVFDWGEMPDHLEGKGKALSQFTRRLYQYLETKGITHHLVNIDCGCDELVVTPFKVFRDGTSLKGLTNVFIPLEVIFRLGYANGSSLKKRMITVENWKAAGFERAYVEGEIFDHPMVEFTTKLERLDRPVDYSEAQSLSGLNDDEWKELIEKSVLIAEFLRDLFIKYNIVLWDGKFEFALGEYKGNNREIILVDSIGPDELRLTIDGVHLSKEVLRQYYRSTEWYNELKKAKEDHGSEFKNYVSTPPVLSRNFKTTIEEMYKILPEIIEGAPDSSKILENIVNELRGVQ
jgi:phosphoribosylaminoimidazole-succinocarboxamide synthase